MACMCCVCYSDLDKEAEQELWFTSLDDFKPICHMLHRQVTHGVGWDGGACNPT